MNATTQYIMGIYQLNLLFRDTLGYLAPKRDDKFTKDLYLQRGENIRRLISEGSPFSNFLKNNAANSTKISDNINDFLETVYSEQSTIFRVVGELVEVDHSQHIRVYEMIMGIYQTLEDILYGYLNHAKETNTFEQEIADAISQDEYFFRSLATYTLSNDMFKLFREYSDAMRSANGQANPIANFISEDLKKVLNLIKFQEKHNKVTIARYKENEEKVNLFINYMTGQTPLPAGSNFETLFTELNEFVFKTLQEAEMMWRDKFVPLFNEYIKLINEGQKKAGNQA